LEVARAIVFHACWFQESLFSRMLDSYDVVRLTDRNPSTAIGARNFLRGEMVGRGEAIERYRDAMREVIYPGGRWGARENFWETSLGSLSIGSSRWPNTDIPSASYRHFLYQTGSLSLVSAWHLLHTSGDSTCMRARPDTRVSLSLGSRLFEHS
jgi:hypothetical protein